MKFEEAYCTSTRKLYDIEVMSTIFKNTPLIFSRTYQRDLHCPECHQAQLMYNNAKTPYFSSYPESIHKLGCYLQQNIMPSKQSAKFVSDKANSAKIQRQMQSVMARLLAIEHVLPIAQAYPPTQVKTSLTSSGEGCAKEVRRLQQKRIDLAFRPDDFGCYKLFYGRVSLEWEWHEKSEEYVLLMRHFTRKQVVCRLKVTPLAYKYVSDAYKFDGTRLGNVVFLSSIEPSDKHYQFATLERGEYLSVIIDDIT